MLLYVTIPLMVAVVVMVLLPLAWPQLYEAWARKTTAAEIAEAAATVRTGPDAETELILRAEAIAEAAARAAEREAAPAGTERELTPV